MDIITNQEKFGFPVSFAQQRLLFMEQIGLTGNPYNLPAAIKMTGAVNVTALEKSIKSLKKRHEVLRTTFPIIAGQQIQMVHTDFEFSLPLLDLSSLSEEESKKEAYSSISNEASRTFNLKDEYAWTVKLLKIKKDEYILVFVTHHIISDGWSIGVFIRELAALYESHQRNEPENLPELPIQYVDYTIWQKEWLTGERLNQQLLYWREQLKGSTDLIQLPTDRQRKPVQTFSGTRHHFKLSKSLKEACTKLCQEEGITLFMLLTATFHLLLARYSNQKDVSIGTPIANRNLKETEGLLGMFVNTLVLRIDSSETKTFQELLQQAKKTCIEAYAHQDLPFERIVEELKPQRDTSRNPLFQVMLNLHPSHDFHKFTLQDVEMSNFHIENNISRFDLSLEIIDNLDSGLLGFIEYNTDLFNRKTILQFEKSLKTILTVITSNTKVLIKDIPLLSKPEQQLLLEEWSSGKEIFTYESPSRAFEKQVLKNPDQIAIEFEDDFLSYEGVNIRANRLAHTLIQKGVGPEVVVGLGVERSIDMIVALIAIMKTGAAYVPIDFSYPEERINFIVKDSSLNVLITDKKNFKSFTKESGIICLNVEDNLSEIKENPLTQVAKKNLAYILYTSGSTGKPKGVQIEYEALNNTLKSYQKLINLKSMDKVLAATSLTFDISISELLLPLTLGGRIVLVSRDTSIDGYRLKENIEKSGITFIQSTPATFQLLLSAKWKPDKGLKIVCGGEALPVSLAKELLESGAELWNVYGPTEATIWAVGHRVKIEEDRCFIGLPLSNVEAYILDEYLQPSPPGVAGELFIGGVQLARGYLNNSNLTEERFINNSFSNKQEDKLYRTGDLVRRAPNGLIEYLGRKDHQVKIRGFRIELEEIEKVLVQHQGIKECVVIVHEKRKDDKSLVAYLTTTNGNEIDSYELSKLLKDYLPVYMIPSDFIHLEKFPLTSSGKINRKDLPLPQSMNGREELNFEAPKDNLEQKIADIWKDVLEINQVSIHSNIFDLGGHSLLLVKIQGQLQDILSIEISVLDLFKYPTISSLSNYLKQEGIELEEDQEIKLSVEVREAWRKENGASKDYIAVIGMDGRWPGANNIDEFWNNLSTGKETISFFSNEELIAAGIEEELISSPNFVKAGGVIEGAELFDASFFEYSPREAELIDPQQRLFLEYSHSVLESAGYAPKSHKGLTGVFAGVTFNGYLLSNLLSNKDLMNSTDPFQILIGNDKDFIATRTAYKLNLRGPSMSIQTACSTSLVAIHNASQSLLNGDCDMALAGGSSVRTPQKSGYVYNKGGILSPDGHCRAFDEKASGTVGGSGVGVVLLKRLKDAIRDRDQIYTVIKATAVNNDGAQKAGFTAPSVQGQTKVILDALAKADVNPSTIRYVESHGTATELGDPIEVEALTRAYRQSTEEKQYCAIGSVKTNIGHLDAAAGVSGFIKAALSLSNKQIPPSLHFNTPNSRINFTNSPFFVNNNLLKINAEKNPLRAAVSSFGIGGTNAHIILEEAPYIEPSSPSRSWHVVPLSAKSVKALEVQSGNLKNFLKCNTELDLADIAYTLQVGRDNYKHRRLIIGQDVEDIIDGLENGELEEVITTHNEDEKKSLLFMFPDSDNQDISIARDFYEIEPIFRTQVDICAEILYPLLGVDIRKIINLNDVSKEFNSEDSLFESLNSKEPLADLKRKNINTNNKVYTESATFVIEYSLGRLLMSYGLKPEAMIGYGIGEYVVATLSEIFTLEDILVLIVKREELRKEFTYSYLENKHEFFDVKPLTQLISNFNLSAPKIPIISNSTGNFIDFKEISEKKYWISNLLSNNDFKDVNNLKNISNSVLLEIGPRLKTLKFNIKKLREEEVIIPVFQDSLNLLLNQKIIQEIIGKLWLKGIDIDWKELYREQKRNRIKLPTYPFERQKFWIEKKEEMVKGPLSNSRKRITDNKKWFYIPSWKKSLLSQKVPLNNKKNDTRWLVFTDEEGLSDKLVEHIKLEGSEVISVKISNRFEFIEENMYSVNPENSKDYHQLIKYLEASGGVPKNIIHAWNINNINESFSYEKTPTIQQLNLGFYSLLYLSQAMAKVKEQVNITIIANDTHQIGEEKLVIPAKAMISSLIKVIPQEMSNISCQFIDLRWPLLNVELTNHLIEHLYEESQTIDKTDVVIAYRGAYRWVQEFEKIEKSIGIKPQILKEKGVYWITGGLGEIGLTLAEYLAKEFQAKLVLTGRTAFPSRENWDEIIKKSDIDCPISRKIRKVKRIEELGSDVLILQADVGNLEQMKEALAKIERNYGSVNGVIHSAGTVGSQSARSISVLTSEDCEKHFNSKIYGVQNLSEIFDRKNLDFCILNSSLSPILGGLGLYAYSAANSYMDAFVAEKNSHTSMKWITINWEGWRYEEDFDIEGNIGATVLKYSISPKEAQQIFKQILSGEMTPQTIVSTGELQYRIKQWSQHGIQNSENIEEEEKRDVFHPRPMLQSAFVAPSSKFEVKLAGIWKELLGIEEIGVNDSFFELGGHSLLALQMIAKLQEITNENFPLHLILEFNTIKSLSSFLEERKEVTSDISSDLQSNVLVPIQKGNTKQALFLVHPVGGNILCYRDLTYHLDNSQTIYGLQAIGIDGTSKILTSIEDIAEELVKVMKKVQSTGPYYLAGWSYGGTVVYEMAQQLLNAGEEVAFVGLIDIRLPKKSLALEEKTVAAIFLMDVAESMGREFPYNLAELEQIEVEEQLEIMLEWVNDEGVLPTENNLSYFHRLFEVFKANYMAWEKYKPQKIFTNLILFPAEIQDKNHSEETNTWMELCEETKIHIIPGNHTEMMQKPNVQNLAEKLSDYL